MSIPRSQIAVLSLTLALASCKGDDPIGLTPAIALSVSPATISVQQGRNDSVVVLIRGVNGFASPVTLSVEGVPTGVVAGFRSTSIPIPANTGVNTGLLIAVNAATAPGSHILTVRARGQGVDDRTATITLNVMPAPPGTLALTLTPAARTVPPGQATTVTASITRGGSFTGAVDLSAEGVPPGVTVAFNPASIPANATTSTVTVTVDASVAPGQYGIVVRAKGQGVSDQIAGLALTVAVAGYSISVSPSTAVAQIGGSTTVEVKIARSGNFTGGVTLALEDAPAGVTATFSQNPATGTRVALLISVAPSTAPGTYTVKVKGTSPGLQDVTATLSLQVMPAGGAANVSFHLCASRPIWVAFQDDAGPWTRVSAGPNETYSFNVSSRGGVAIVRPSGSAYRIDVIYATAAELAQIGLRWDRACSAPPAGTKQLTGTLTGLEGQDVSISLGPRGAIVSQDQTSYTLRNVPDGALDLVASRGHAGMFDFDATKLIIRRGLDLPNGAVIPLLDFNAAEAVTPVHSTVTVNGLASEELSWLMTYQTTGGTEELLNAHLGGLPVSTLPYAGVPTSVQAPGDLHLLFIEAFLSNSVRRLFSAFHRAENRAVTLGPQLTTPTVSVVASSPYARYRMSLPVQSEYNSEVIARFIQPATLATITVSATAGYFGGFSSVWDLAVPDLTSAAGFDPNWGLRAGSPTQWEAFATSGSFLLPLSLSDGETVRIAGRWDGAPPASMAARRSLGVRSARNWLDEIRARSGGVP
jgi:hypothetical protein